MLKYTYPIAPAAIILVYIFRPLNFNFFHRHYPWEIWWNVLLFVGAEVILGCWSPYAHAKSSGDLYSFKLIPFGVSLNFDIIQRVRLYDFDPYLGNMLYAKINVWHIMLHWISFRSNHLWIWIVAVFPQKGHQSDYFFVQMISTYCTLLNLPVSAQNASKLLFF